MLEAGHLDTVSTLVIWVLSACNEEVTFLSLSLSSALDYIEELLTLLTKHDAVQISENISEETENLVVSHRSTSMKASLPIRSVTCRCEPFSSAHD